MSLFTKNKIDIFNKVTLVNYDILKDYFNNDKLDMLSIGSDAYPVCSFTYLDCYYTIYDGYLFIITKNKELLHIPFDADGNFISFDMLKKFMEHNYIKNILFIPEDAFVFNSDIVLSLKNIFMVKQMKSFGYEYVYDNFLLYKKEGKEFANFRGNINKYINKYSDKTEIIKYDGTQFDDAMLAYKHWMETNAKKILKRNEDIWDSDFYLFCLNNFDKLCIEFYLVYYDGVCIGTFCYQIINKNMSYCLFRKLSEEYHNLVQYAQYYQAKLLTDKNVQFYNDAYDGSSKGLCDLKTRFKPVRKVKLYSLTLKN